MSAGESVNGFAIVRFTHDADAGAPSVVPTNWLLPGKKQCYWPPEDLRDNKAVIKRRLPSETWAIYHVKVLKEYGMMLLSLRNVLNLI
jgi:hypothetical protein